MADVNFKVVRVALNTSTGTQDITISGFGTPKAAIFYSDGVLTDDTITNSTRNSVGYTDGTNEAVVANFSLNGFSASDTSRLHRTDSVILVISQTAETGRANFDSFITDGVRIDITDAPPTANFVTVILINGDDVSDVKVETKQLTTTSTVITTVGFESSLVFLNSVGINAIDGSVGGQALMSNGIAVNDGSDSNFGILQFDQDAQGTSNTGQFTSNTDSVGQFFNNSLTWGGDVNTYTSTGFTISTSASPGDDFVSYLALKFTNSPLVDVSIVDSPTATGDKSFGSTASQPDFNLMITGNSTALDTNTSGVGFSTFVADATNQFGNSYSMEDAAATMVVDSISASGNLVQLFNGVKEFEASFTNFTSSGADFNFSTVDGTARKWISLFIGSGAASTGVTVNDLSQSQTIDQPALTQHNILAINDLSNAQTIDQVTLTQVHILSVNSLDVSQTIDQLNLTQQNVLSVNDASQNQTIDQINLTQHNILSVDELLQSQGLDVVTLSTITSALLSIVNLSQNQTIDANQLVQHSVLSVNDLSQAQLIDVVNFAGIVVGFLEGELSIVYAYNNQTMITNALTGETSIIENLTGESEIL